MGVLVSPEKALNASARRRDGRVERTRLSGDERRRLQRRLMTVGETARCRQCPGTGEQKLNAVLSRRGLREEPQRPAEPPGGAFGREACCCLAGLAQDGNGGEVTLACRPLDVVSARRGRRPPRRECLCAPLVRPKPPATSGRLVDSAPDERVTETEASWYVGGPDEVKPQELVDRVHPRRLRCSGGRGRQLWLEWIARHRGAFEHEASGVGQQCEFFGQRSGDRRRDVQAGQ